MDKGNEILEKYTEGLNSKEGQDYIEDMKKKYNK